MSNILLTLIKYISKSYPIRQGIPRHLGNFLFPAAYSFSLTHTCVYSTLQVIDCIMNRNTLRR